jgi:hypothetical protein
MSITCHDDDNDCNDDDYDYEGDDYDDDVMFTS